MKFCPECGLEKPLELFPKNRRNKDGYHSSCKSCHTARTKARYKEKRQEILEAHKKYYETHKEEKKRYDKKYYLKNKEKKHKDNKRWNDRNRDYLNTWISDWKKDNPDKVREYSAKRRSKKLEALPSWLTQEQLSQISLTYQLAKKLELLTGETHHVDHIIPLQGKDVCGLHVPWNLQAIPASVNLRKSNKLE